MGNRWPQDEPDVELAAGSAGRSAGGQVELDDDVGILALRADEVARVGFPPLQLGEDLLSGVAAFGGIALELPDSAQFLRRAEKHFDFVEEPKGVVAVTRRQNARA